MGIIMVYKPTYNWGGPSCVITQKKTEGKLHSNFGVLIILGIYELMVYYH
jgi:hypothetical protein